MNIGSLQTILSSVVATVLLAPGCGGKVVVAPNDAGEQSGDSGPISNATCESACASCPGSTCVPSCQALEAQCQAAGLAAGFQTYVNCVAASNCAFDPTCGQPPSCYPLPDGIAPLDSQAPSD